MKELVVARNVVNTDEIVAWLDTLAETYSTLALWVKGPVRKWVNKNAPTEPFVAKDLTGLPDWLRKSMAEGQAAENVILDDDLRSRIVPVLDYMTEWTATKPDANPMTIGFDVAEVRAKEWHDAMAKKAIVVKPIPEDGAEIYKDYGNGWTWRKLIGKECLINEGESMGHCVGRFGYYERILRDKVDIFSLRGPDNVPHVTIECNMRDGNIDQIKGRANEAVIPKYLPMVKSFLDDHEWNRISFDGAQSLKPQVLQQQRQNRKPLAQVGDVWLIRVPSDYYDCESYVIATKGPDLGKLVVQEDSRKIIALDVLLSDPVIAMLKRAIDALNLKVGSSHSLAFLFENHGPNGRWNRIAETDTAKAIGVSHIDGMVPDQVYTQADGHASTPCVALYDSQSQTVFINQTVNDKAALAVALEIDSPVEHVIRRQWNTGKSVVMVDVQGAVRKLKAGKTVKHVDGNDEQLLNSLMTALKQPDLATIKAAYLRLKTKTEVLDSHMKQLGMPVSGRAINGIAAVMMCTLPVQNNAPFQRYVFEKPNLLTCWMEVLTKPDHILAGLKQYGLEEETIANIVVLLRNEFLRLVPADLDALDLELGPKSKVKTVMQWAAGHRIDQPRSKKLWGSV